MSLPRGVSEALRRERGETVTAAHDRRGGANSRVWEVETTSGARYFVKQYPPALPGEQDRLDTEFAALDFLARHDVRCVPAAVVALRAERLGIFGLVPGRPLTPGQVGEEEVGQAAAFLARLHALRCAEGAAVLPVAKEACFSVAAHEDLVRDRARRLRDGSPDSALQGFLEREFAPQLERISAWVETTAAASGLDRGAELPATARTLSPSDFGFHNALLGPDGRLAFIDFEYFGWDDPAKTVADFFLQPAVPVPAGLRPLFCHELARSYGPGADLARRLPPVHALLALKWCLIVLNPFLRTRAGATGEAAERTARLALARVLLGRARREFAERAFPFGGI